MACKSSTCFQTFSSQIITSRTWCFLCIYLYQCGCYIKICKAFEITYSCRMVPDVRTEQVQSLLVCTCQIPCRRCKGMPPCALRPRLFPYMLHINTYPSFALISIPTQKPLYVMKSSFQGEKFYLKKIEGGGGVRGWERC